MSSGKTTVLVFCGFNNSGGDDDESDQCPTVLFNVSTDVAAEHAFNHLHGGLNTVLK